jgi:uncharacterized protein YraI
MTSIGGAENAACFSYSQLVLALHRSLSIESASRNAEKLAGQGSTATFSIAILCRCFTLSSMLNFERSGGQSGKLGAKSGRRADLSAKNCRCARDGVPHSRPLRNPVLRKSWCGRLESMRSSLGLMTLALLLLAIPAWSQSYVGAQEWGEVRPEVVNVRAGPGTEYKVVRNIHRGESVYVERLLDGWAEVDTDRDYTEDGWIRADLLAEEGSLPSGGIDEEEARAIVLLLFLVLAICVYLLPSSIAHTRKHQNRVAIFLVNLFLGWSGAAWIVALIWSLTAVEKKPKGQRD